MRRTARPAIRQVDPEKPHLGIEVLNAPVGSKLLQVTRRHYLLAAEMLKGIGLMPPQELILMRLADHGPCSHTEMVRFFGRDRSTITKTLQAMERAGLIEKRPSETDGRAIVITLSEKGRALHAKVVAIWDELERRTTSELSERHVQAVLQAFDAMLAGLTMAR